jgi:hypothetical protein
MKKILPLIFPVFFIFNISNSQILNQPANWPNEDWSLSGSYDPVYLYEDPTVNAGSNSFITYPRFLQVPEYLELSFNNPGTCNKNLTRRSVFSLFRFIVLYTNIC